MRAKPIRYLLAVVCGLTLSVYFAPAWAEGASECKAVPVTVVNGSNHDVTLTGATGSTLIKANTTDRVVFQSGYFYNQCGLIQLGFNDQSFKRGLIAAQSENVDIHVRPNGEVEQLGLTEAGFDLDNYITWWGLRKVVG